MKKVGKMIGAGLALLVLVAVVGFGGYCFSVMAFNTVFRRCINNEMVCVDTYNMNGADQLCSCPKGMRWFWEDDPPASKK